ncbi:diphthine-ammonia ligase [Nematocida sp. ERTm5]|nr:diphthine-ammonia ligase [Nematocida sp. ERTm5]
MLFVGLISGGKDSIYNMQMCIEDGHTPVCLLHMKMEKEEDSYMFQYAGCNLLPAIAECLDLPLHQFSTSGVSKDRSIDYKITEKDEIEDLFCAISSLLKKYSFSGVSVGAISSVYQYNRVKSVCDRLGLTMLGYLWGSNQKALLSKMIENNVYAVVVKGGEYVSNLVGESLQGVRDKYSAYILEQIHKYPGLKEEDFNLCGEGGEYETITLDAKIYKKKIEIVKSDVVEVDSVKRLDVLEYRVVPK